MIDIENEVYTQLADAIREQYPNTLVSGEYVNAPTQFPYVSIVEVDNYSAEKHMDNGDTEKYATITYEVNVYVNNIKGKKKICRRIMCIVDAMMLSLNFTRLSLTPVPNLENATIYRIVGRYRAETDGNTIYRG